MRRWLANITSVDQLRTHLHSIRLTLEAWGDLCAAIMPIPTYSVMQQSIGFGAVLHGFGWTHSGSNQRLEYQATGPFNPRRFWGSQRLIRGYKDTPALITVVGDAPNNEFRKVPDGRVHVAGEAVVRNTLQAIHMESKSPDSSVLLRDISSSNKPGTQNMRLKGIGADF